MNSGVNESSFLTALFLIINTLSPVLADKPPAVAHPGTELWREVRQADIGRSQAQGVDSGILINSRGQQWREFRMRQLLPYGGYALGGVAGLILLFYLIRGTIRIDNGRSGGKIPRFSVNERIAHWFLVVLFMILALTGLVLLYGRTLLLPLLGAEGFAALAAACKEAHNLFGPIFAGAVLVVFFLWVKKNFYRRGDLLWLLNMKRNGYCMMRETLSSGPINTATSIFRMEILLCIA